MPRFFSTALIKAAHALCDWISCSAYSTGTVRTVWYQGLLSVRAQLKISVAVAYCTVPRVLYHHHGMPCPPLQILFSMTMDKLSCDDYPGIQSKPTEINKILLCDHNPCFVTSSPVPRLPPSIPTRVSPIPSIVATLSTQQWPSFPSLSSFHRPIVPAWQLAPLVIPHLCVAMSHRVLLQPSSHAA